MLDEVPELLSILGGSVGGSNVYSVLEVLSNSPCSRLRTFVLPLIVYQPVQEDGVTGTHDIVEEDTGLDNEPQSVSMMAHGGEKNLKAVSKDAKRILNHSPGPVKPVVEDPLLPVQVPGTVWLHQVGPQGEGIVPPPRSRVHLGCRWGGDQDVANQQCHHSPAQLSVHCCRRCGHLTRSLCQTHPPR